MGSGSGGQSANTEKMIRYAPYIEEKHSNLLGTVAGVRTDIINNSPYTDYIDQNITDAFLGMGYAIADFPSLYDMFGKFMSGLDIEAVWESTFNEQAQMTEVNGVVRATTDITDDILLRDSIPQFKLDMRNNNAVISSSFVIGKAGIERKRMSKLAAISAEAKFKILPNVSAKNNAILNWQKGTTDSYAEIMKLYYMTAMTGIETDTTFAAKNILWPFEALDFERVALGSMRGTIRYGKSSFLRKRSTISKILFIASWTANGAFVGNMIGGPVGAAIGAAVGFVVGVAQVLFE